MESTKQKQGLIVVFAIILQCFSVFIFAFTIFIYIFATEIHKTLIICGQNLVIQPY